MGNVAKNMSLFILCLLISATLLSPYSRLNMATLLQPPAREVVATLSFEAASQNFKIIKIKKGSGLAVEIYKTKPGSLSADLQAVFEIPDSKDVFYDFKSSLSNLFEANIDEDPATEIIVPVMDNNLVSRLSVIKYEPQSQQFTYHSP